MEELSVVVEAAWDKPESVAVDVLKAALEKVWAMLDAGTLRVAEKQAGQWLVNEWVKKAVLLQFRHTQTTLLAANGGVWYDKIPLKWDGWDEERFKAAGFRAVPGAVARRSAFIGQGVVLMPSFVNVAAHVGAGTMIDTWATVGSCAQIGKNCHISGGVGIGGVLEPIQAAPVIIEDGCFIGARSEIAEGVIVEEGAVLGMGVYLGASTKIIDRETGEVYYGRVPAYSVVVPGSSARDDKGVALYSAVIIKKVDERTRSKTQINELLRS